MRAPCKGSKRAERKGLHQGPLSTLKALSKVVVPQAWTGSHCLAWGIGTTMPSRPKGSIPARLLSYQEGEGTEGGRYPPRWAKVKPCFLPRCPSQRHKELGFHDLAFNLGG